MLMNDDSGSADVADVGSEAGDGGSDNTEATTASVNWGEIIPKDLQEKDTFKNILKSENPGLELAKQLDSAQSLIGRKASGRPADDAADAEWDEYYNSVRPKSYEDYTIDPVDLGEDRKELAERINGLRNEDDINEIKKLAYECGLPKREFEKFAKQFRIREADSFEKLLQSSAQAEQQANEFFDTEAKKWFGGDSDKMVQFGSEMMKRVLTQDQLDIIRALPESVLPNQALFLAASIGKFYHDKYERQDSFDPGSFKKTPGSLEEVNAEMKTLMQSEAYLNVFHADNKLTKAKVEELAKRISTLQKS